MSDVEPAALLEELKRLTRRTRLSEAPSLQTEPNCRRLFDTLNDLIVGWPKAKPLASEVSDLLDPIVNLFGSDHDLPSKRLSLMIDAIISAAADRSYWMRLFHGTGDMTDRLGLERPRPKAQATSLRSKQTEAVYRFGALLIEVCDRILSESPALFGQIRNVVIDCYQPEVAPAAPTVTVRVVIPDQSSLTTSIVGDGHSWYVAMLRAKVHKPVPETNVQVSGEGRDGRWAEKILAHTIAETFRMTVDEFVVEVCRLAIQFGGPNEYRDEGDVSKVVATTLRQGWDRVSSREQWKDPGSIITLVARYVHDPNLAIEVLLRNSELSDTVGIGFRLWAGGFLQADEDLRAYLTGSVRSLSDFSGWYRRSDLFPLLIWRWLSTRKHLDGSEFFQMKNWAVCLMWSDEDRSDLSISPVMFQGAVKSPTIRDL